MRKTTLGNHLVPEILAHLRKMSPLPERGILGGQAVASAILDLYYGGGGVYNDIDIFLLASEDKLTELKDPARIAEDALRLGLPIAVIDEDYRQLGLSDSAIKIAGCDEDGLLNTIWCDPAESELLPGRLVYGFDLNAVEVALDIEHQELTWSKAFERFLETRELEITSLATPYRTLLRYFKKRYELKAFGQDELVRNMVATWVTLTEHNSVTHLTTKMQGLAERFAAELGAAYVLKDGSLDVEETWKAPANLSEQIEDCLVDEAEVGGLTRLVPSKVYMHSREQSAELQSYVDELLKEFADKQQTDYTWDHLLQLCAQVMGPDYVRGDRSKKHLEVVLRAVTKHEDLTGALLGLTLDEQYRCVLDLNKRAKARGPIVYGLVAACASPVDMWDAHHREQFFKQVERETPGGELCKPYFTTMEKDGWSIRELRSNSALRTEGSVMNHCVGGYGSAVRSLESKILAIRHSSDAKLASTVELRGKFEPEGVIRISQHYTYGNKEPAKETAEVLRTYLKEQCAALNLTLRVRNNHGPFGNRGPFGRGVEDEFDVAPAMANGEDVFL
jgi:hypothetical protein